MTKEQAPQDANEGTMGPSRSTVGLGIISTELKPGCPPVFQGVTEAEMAEMTPKQREFLRTWG